VWLNIGEKSFSQDIPAAGAKYSIENGKNVKKKKQCSYHSHINILQFILPNKIIGIEWSLYLK